MLRRIYLTSSLVVVFTVALSSMAFAQAGQLLALELLSNENLMNGLGDSGADLIDGLADAGEKAARGREENTVDQLVVNNSAIINGSVKVDDKAVVDINVNSFDNVDIDNMNVSNTARLQSVKADDKAYVAINGIYLNDYRGKKIDVTSTTDVRGSIKVTDKATLRINTTTSSKY